MGSWTKPGARGRYTRAESESGGGARRGGAGGGDEGLPSSSPKPLQETKWPFSQHLRWEAGGARGRGRASVPLNILFNALMR